MHKNRYISILFFLSTFIGLSNAQIFRLNSWKYLTDISTNLDDFFNYNQYEATRLGIGLSITTPLKYDTAYARDKQNSFKLDVFGAYGTRDNAFKYGATAKLLFPRSKPQEWFVGYKHDLDRVGSKQLGAYSLLATYDNASYVTSHYSEVDRLTAGFSKLRIQKNLFDLDVRFSKESYLFDNLQLFYPRMNGKAYPFTYFREAHARMTRGDWTIDLLGGQHAQDRSDFASSVAFVRAVAQYAHTLTTGLNKNKTRLFIQAGASTDNTPFSRMFDLSGTGGSYYFFRNSFMTVAPNSFMANDFAQVCLSYTRTKPLWTSKVSNPRVFAQINGMWGMANSSSNTRIGNSLYAHALSTECTPGMANPYFEGNPDQMIFLTPDKGLFEFAAGIDRLFRWGWLDIGFSVAYQLTPSSAPYHHATFAENFALMGVASLFFNE